jgi:hypothetical protein
MQASVGGWERHHSLYPDFGQPLGSGVTALDTQVRCQSRFSDLKPIYEVLSLTSSDIAWVHPGVCIYACVWVSGWGVEWGLCHSIADARIQLRFPMCETSPRMTSGSVSE